MTALLLLVLTGCGTPSAEAPVPAPPAVDADVVGWTCPMHPSIKTSDPGDCPICGMDLVPVTREALASGAVLVDGVRRQQLGIRTAPVTRGFLEPTVRAVGVVQVDERALHEVNARVDGFVERLHVEEVGGTVRAGQPLLELYGPELYATQQDLLRATSSGSEQAARDARRRLELWGFAPSTIDAVVAAGEPRRALPILAPASGTVLEKDVVEGARILAGQRLFRVADLSRVWVEAKVFEDAADRVQPGQDVTIRREGVEAPVIAGQVDRVLPMIDTQARAARVRVAVRNPGDLRVGAYVDVGVHTPTDEALLVPRDAVIVAGSRRIVFVDRGSDRLVPTDVRLGRRGELQVEVAQGLSEGDQVVVSGNFLVAAESRLQSATGFWAREAEHGTP